MRPKDEIEELFERLGSDWDMEEPGNGHQERFVNKLHRDKATKNSHQGAKMWKYISIAASVALLFTIGIQYFNQPQEKPTQTKVANYIPEGKPEEVQRTEYYFYALIAQEIEKIDQASGEKTKRLVDDLKSQLLRLENDYKLLEADLSNKGDVKQILNAMMINFQTRIKLAQEVLNKIQEIENLKNTKHEEQTV
ncbi:hypothetical protein [Galbibacter sp.]|uniref:hypothetical protein n=1 Tax=Galbibacter sp. TaxID=2918471 RepID=UPI002C968C2C|nr:hypothetical protein [Galbibacter sp.]HLV61861.1 hypothetical protein [Galbibacter sp.]